MCKSPRILPSHSSHERFPDSALLILTSPSLRMIFAVVAIEESYTRDRVRQALQRYPSTTPIQTLVCRPQGSELTVDRFNRLLSLVPPRYSDGKEDAPEDTREKETGHKVLFWMEYEDLPWEWIFSSSSPSSSQPLSSPSRLPTHDVRTPFDRDMPCYANSYCIRKGLIRKAQFAYHVQKYTSKHPDSILRTAVPETYIMELDHPDYLEETMNDLFEVAADLARNEQCTANSMQRKRFLLKPSMTNKGNGIFLFDSMDRLQAIVEEIYGIDDETDSEDEDEDEENVDGNHEHVENHDADDVDDDEDDDGREDLRNIREWIVQAYVDRPLLLPAMGHRKFHVRAYVLAVGNIQVYLYEEMLALFAMNSYLNADGELDMDDPLAQLTNTCLQADHPDFVESESVRLFSDIIGKDDGDLGRRRHREILGQMKAILHDVFDAVVHEVTTFQPRPNCFELFGMDFLVDEQYRVSFLEANSFPGKLVGVTVVAGLRLISSFMWKRFQANGQRPRQNHPAIV